VPTSKKSQVRSGVETDKTQDQIVNTGGRAPWFYTSLVTPTFKKCNRQVLRSNSDWAHPERLKADVSVSVLNS
jgi:hypothetical protein